MALILCPECGSKISDKACTCPHCGYYCSDSTLPISAQESYDIIPLNVEIEIWGQDEQTKLARLAPEDKKTLAAFLAKGERFEKYFPAVAENIKELLTIAETEYRAKLTPELRRLMAEGKLSFKLDKQGEIMAILQNGKKRISNQIRLEEAQFDPNTAQSLTNLTNVAMFNQILDEIGEAKEAIEAIHVELQDDRLAMAEAARDRLIQASKIQDSGLRAYALLAAIGEATNAKHQLMRNFERNRLVLEKEADKSIGQMFLEPSGRGKSLGDRADDAMEDLSLISVAVQVECAGWAMLAEGESARHCLDEFRGFIRSNKLDDSDTLVMIYSHSENNWNALAEKFGNVANRIEGMSAAQAFLPSPSTDQIGERD